MGIKFEVYPKEGGIHVFQAPYVVEEHGEKRNPGDKLLLMNLGNYLSQKSITSWRSDYNRCINAPFVYQSTSPKYHELVEN